MTKNATVAYLVLAAIRNEYMCSRERLCEFVGSNVEFSLQDEDTKAIAALIDVEAIYLNEQMGVYMPGEYFQRTYDKLHALHVATLAAKCWGLSSLL